LNTVGPSIRQNLDSAIELIALSPALDGVRKECLLAKLRHLRDTLCTEPCEQGPDGCACTRSIAEVFGTERIGTPERPSRRPD
jgi:hypothetical protein